MAGYSENKRTYYSDTKPKGQGKIDASSYNYDMANTMERIYYNNPSLSEMFSLKDAEPRTKEEVAEIQQFLLKQGYFDNESEIDSLYGNKTAGASHRYLLNAPSVIEKIVDWMNNE